MVSQKHKLLTNLLSYIASQKGFSTELEPVTVTGVKPDALFKSKGHFNIHLETQLKGDQFKTKLEKTEKAHAKLLFIDGSKFDFDDVSVNALMKQLEFMFEQAMLKAEAPVGRMKFQKFWPWIKKGEVGTIFHTPRREARYRYYHAKIGKLFWLTPLRGRTYEDLGIIKIKDVWKEPLDGFKSRFPNAWVEFAYSVHRYEEDREKDKIPLLECEIVEVF